MRQPDGLCVAYPALDLTTTLTPSRLLFSSDLLLPYYLLEVCLDAYVDKNQYDTTGNYLVSPLYAPDDLLKKLPPLYLQSAGFDPLLDDTTRFIRRLDHLGIEYQQRIYELPHGFWNFGAIIDGGVHATNHACEWMQNLFLESEVACAKSKDQSK